MLRRILLGSRFFILIAVIGSLAAAIVTMVFGGIAVVANTLNAIDAEVRSSTAVKDVAIGFLEVIDVFLLATVLYIVALGLYELFLDPQMPGPPWLKIETLDDLKERLVTVVVVMLGVTFLAFVVDYKAAGSVLEVGAAIALILAALGVFFKLARNQPRG